MLRPAAGKVEDKASIWQSMEAMGPILTGAALHAEVYVRDGLGYEDEPDDLKINLGEHLLRAVFSIAASTAWVSQGSSPAQCALLHAFRVSAAPNVEPSASCRP